MSDWGKSDKIVREGEWKSRDEDRRETQQVERLKQQQMEKESRQSERKGPQK